MRGPFVFTVAILALFVDRISSTTVTSVEEARALWNSWSDGEDLDYTFHYSHSDLEMEYYVDVREGEVTGFSTGDYLVPDTTSTPSLDDFPTIEELFDAIEAADSPEVSFNQKYGYPTDFVVEGGAEIHVSSLVPYTFVQQTLDTMMELWDSQETPIYSFTITVTCFCFEDYVNPKRIEVTNGEITSVVDIASGEASPYDYYTMQGLFGLVQQAIDGYYIEINITYDEELGYPTLISTNPELMLADAGVWIQVSDVTLVEYLFETPAPVRKGRCRFRFFRWLTNCD